MHPTVFDFDAYLRTLLEPKKGALGLVARHKLLYAVHRLAICKTGVPAFEDRCEAWKLGPVFVPLWNNPNKSGNPDVLTVEQKEFCQLVARILGTQSGRSLAARSHAKYPEWHNARRASRRKHTNAEITVDAIREQLVFGRIPTSQAVKASF
jgi:uncharacterized phage-associated protein